MSVSVAVCHLQEEDVLEEKNNGRLSWAMPHSIIEMNWIKWGKDKTNYKLRYNEKIEEEKMLK